MAVEENTSIVRRFWQAVNNRDMDALDKLVADDVVVHFTSLSEPVRSREAWKQVGAAFFTAFPDLQEVAEDVIAEDDRVAARVTWRGTHQGDLMGIPPTGKQVTVSGMRIFRIADSKIAEEWAIDDALGMLQQLGLMPAPGQSAA